MFVVTILHWDIDKVVFFFHIVSESEMILILRYEIFMLWREAGNKRMVMRMINEGIDVETKDKIKG